MKFNPDHPVSQMLTDEMWRKFAFLILRKLNLKEIKLDAEFINLEINKSHEEEPKALAVQCSDEHVHIKIVSEVEAKELAKKNRGPAQ